MNSHTHSAVSAVFAVFLGLSVSYVSTLHRFGLSAFYNLFRLIKGYVGLFRAENLLRFENCSFCIWIGNAFVLGTDKNRINRINRINRNAGGLK